MPLCTSIFPALLLTGFPCHTLDVLLLLLAAALLCCSPLSLLSFSIPLSVSLTSPPLTFQHYPLLLPPDKASIVSQMLFNMDSLSLCPSIGQLIGPNQVLFLLSL